MSNRAVAAAVYYERKCAFGAPFYQAHPLNEETKNT